MRPLVLACLVTLPMVGCARDVPVGSGSCPAAATCGTDGRGDADVSRGCGNDVSTDTSKDHANDYAGTGWLPASAEEEAAMYSGRCTIPRKRISDWDPVKDVDGAFVLTDWMPNVAPKEGAETFAVLCRRSSLLQRYGNTTIVLSTANTHSYDKKHVSLREYIDIMMEPRKLSDVAGTTYYHFGDNNCEHVAVPRRIGSLSRQSCCGPLQTPVFPALAALGCRHHPLGS